MQGKAFSCEAWGHDHGFIHAQSLPVATVFKLGSHWVPVSMNPVGDALHVFVWDAEGTDHLQLNEVIERVGLAMGFVSVCIQCDKRMFLTSELCGTLAIAYLHHVYLHVRLPATHDETMQRFQMYRGDFVTSLSTCDITRRPWVWAQGDQNRHADQPVQPSDTVPLPVTLTRDQRLDLIAVHHHAVADDEIRFHILHIIDRYYAILNERHREPDVHYLFFEPLVFTCWESIGRTISARWCERNPEVRTQGNRSLRRFYWTIIGSRFGSCPKMIASHFTLLYMKWLMPRNSVTFVPALGNSWDSHCLLCTFHLHSCLIMTCVARSPWCSWHILFMVHACLKPLTLCRRCTPTCVRHLWPTCTPKVWSLNRWFGGMDAFSGNQATPYNALLEAPWAARTGKCPGFWGRELFWCLGWLLLTCGSEFWLVYGPWPGSVACWLLHLACSDAWRWCAGSFLWLPLADSSHGCCWDEIPCWALASCQECQQMPGHTHLGSARIAGAFSQFAEFCRLPGVLAGPVVLIGNHWVPVVCARCVHVVRVFVPSMYHSVIQPLAVDCPELIVQCVMESQSHNLCGAYKFHVAAYFMCDRPLCSSDEELECLHFQLKHDFALGGSQGDLTGCVGFGAQGTLLKELAAVLVQHLLMTERLMPLVSLEVSRFWLHWNIVSHGDNWKLWGTKRNSSLFCLLSLPESLMRNLEKQEEKGRVNTLGSSCRNVDLDPGKLQIVDGIFRAQDKWSRKSMWSKLGQSALVSSSCLFLMLSPISDLPSVCLLNRLHLQYCIDLMLKWTQLCRISKSPSLAGARLTRNLSSQMSRLSKLGEAWWKSTRPWLGWTGNSWCGDCEIPCLSWWASLWLEWFLQSAYSFSGQHIPTSSSLFWPRMSMWQVAQFGESGH